MTIAEKPANAMQDDGIQTFASTDVARVSHLQPDGWDDIETFFRFYTESPFCQAIKIENKDQILAVGALISFRTTAWFAHIIVAAHCRRNGLGSRITQELIRRAEKNGCGTQLLIATELGAPLYEHFGFRRSCDYHYYEEHAPDRVNTPPEIRPLEPEDIPEIMALDLRATGEYRKNLLSPFCRRGWVHAGADGMNVRGFYLPDLGEGIIVAEDSIAGSALMKLRITSKTTPPVLSAENRQANQWLTEWGFKLRTTAPRMVRGGADPSKTRMIFNRIGGHVG